MLAEIKYRNSQVLTALCVGMLSGVAHAQFGAGFIDGYLRQRMYQEQLEMQRQYQAQQLELQRQYMELQRQEMEMRLRLMQQQLENRSKRKE